MQAIIVRVAIGVIAIATAQLAIITQVVAQNETQRRASPELRLPAMWQYSAPLITPEKRADEPSRAQKDPTLVNYQGVWHVFLSLLVIASSHWKPRCSRRVTRTVFRG